MYFHSIFNQSDFQSNFIPFSFHFQSNFIPFSFDLHSDFNPFLFHLYSIFILLYLIVFQVRTYKRQIEEAEEIAALNLAKFRKAQVDLQESLERADISEQALAKSRVRGRSLSLARDL